MQLFSYVLYLELITSVNCNSWKNVTYIIFLIAHYKLKIVASIFPIYVMFCTEMLSSVFVTRHPLCLIEKYCFHYI